MLKNFIFIIKKNIQIFSLVMLIIFTAASTTFFNYKKDITDKNFDNFINNLYLKKL